MREIKVLRISLCALLIVSLAFGCCGCGIIKDHVSVPREIFNATVKTAGITPDISNDYARIVLDGFKGEYKFKIPKENVHEGTFYCRASLIEGEADISYDYGWIWYTYPMLTAVAGVEGEACAYLDSSVSKATVIIRCESETSGVIIFEMK